MAELHPNTAANADPNSNWIPPGAIPERFRKFGKFLATSSWWPGDLLLTRSVTPDRVSKALSEAQVKGGDHQIDAAWTHAAVYIGDGLSLCEATFDSVITGGEVRITPLWDYCGDYVIKVRRSKYVTTRDAGWLLAIYTLTNLRKAYDFGYIRKLGFRAFRGQGFWQSDIRVPIKAQALVCSTLFADAHSKTTRHVFGEANGLCVPAFLSQCTDLAPVTTEWINIASASR
jgi:hypothetical protein